MTSELLAIQSLFYIQDKSTAQRIPFVPNAAQKLLDEHDNPTGRTRIIVAKARQKGFSSIVLAKFAVRCLGREGTHAVVISHEAESTQRLFDRVGYYLKHMNGPKPTFGLNSRHERSFPLRDSTYYIGTAGSRAFGRGDFITDLHCSEYAWWDDAERHTAGLFQAVPYEGRIYIESTGNGRNNDFYYMWAHAESIGYTRVFYPWFADDEYALPVESWKPDIPGLNHVLRELQEKHNLSDQQMAWYELKLKEHHEDLRSMRQEYPSTPDDCFQATGGRVFLNVRLEPSRSWRTERYKNYFVERLADHPKPSKQYVIGADPSGGTGRDNSAIQIFCVDTFEQVLEFAVNTVNPVQFAELLVDLGNYFNDAFITCEANNHGAAVIAYLKEHYKHNLIYKRRLGSAKHTPQYGWLNTQTSKHALVGILQETLCDLKIYGMRTIGELESFEETESGKLGGKRDDLVIALGLAVLGLKRFEHRRQQKPAVMKQKSDAVSYGKYFTFDEIVGSIRRRKQRERRQVQVG